MVLAIVFLSAFVGLFVTYLITTNMVFGYMFIAPAIAGWFFMHRFRKARDVVAETIYSRDQIPTTQVNSMNLYPPSLGGVKFENIAKPEGQPWICDNDGKPYFVHIWNTATNRLVEFALPDQQYYDPRVFAERVLELPAHRRIFMRKQTMLQKLSPFMLLLIIVVLWIVIITTGPTPTPGG